MIKNHCHNPEERKFVYDDFVRDLRWNHEYPFIHFPNEYNGEEVVKLCCTQHNRPEKERRKITKEWVDFLSTNKLPIKEVQLCTLTTQAVLDALCNQDSIESLTFKWLRCKNIEAVSNLKNLKRLFFQSAPSITDISPIAELENLETLILGSTKKVTDYSPLGKLKNLKNLCICSYQTRDDAMLMENDAFIENMESLEYLDLMDGVI